MKECWQTHRDDNDDNTLFFPIFFVLFLFFIFLMFVYSMKISYGHLQISKLAKMSVFFTSLVAKLRRTS